MRGIEPGKGPSIVALDGISQSFMCGYCRPALLQALEAIQRADTRIF